MIYMILKFGKPSGGTFNKQWYDDVDISKISKD